MTNREFHEWWAHHRASFPAIDRWLGRMDKTAREDDDMRSADVLRKWYGVLRDVDLADAKTATDAMMRGDIDEPRSWDSHPKAIRRAALGRRSDRKIANQHESPTRYVTDENGETVAVYLCPECQDDGLITVWHPKSAQAMHDGKLGAPYTRYSCGVRCNEDRCQAKDRWRGVPIVFDPEKMCRCEYHPSEADEESLRQFVASIGQGTMFDPFSGPSYDDIVNGDARP